MSENKRKVKSHPKSDPKDEAKIKKALEKISKTAKINLPGHKELCLVHVADHRLVLPAIYYHNQSFTGFYHYTSFYALPDLEEFKTVYSKTKLKEKHKIKNVIDWILITPELEEDLKWQSIK